MDETSIDYSTAQAAKLAGISTATLRNLTTGQFAGYYAGVFSKGASPGSGQTRRLTERDVNLLRFIQQQTKHGLLHEEIAQKIRAGEMVEVAASPAEAEIEPPEPGAADEDHGQALIAAQPPVAILVQGVMAELVANRAEVTAAREREGQLVERLIAAESARAAAEASRVAALARVKELAAELDRQRRPFWRRWFGE